MYVSLALQYFFLFLKLSILGIHDNTCETHETLMCFMVFHAGYITLYGMYACIYQQIQMFFGMQSNVFA